jgi:hypothetical protein
VGDIADYAIDQMVEQGMWGRARPRRPRAVTCKFCGKPNLRWQEQQQWALVDAKGAIHFCRGSAAPDEFEDLGSV